VTIAVETTGTTTTFAVAGELDVLTAPELNLALAGVVGDVVLDLAGVTFMDSSGLALVAHRRCAARARGHRLTVAGMRPHLLQAFAMAGLDDVLLGRAA